MRGNWIFGTVLAIVVAAGVAPHVFPTARPVPLSTPLAVVFPVSAGPWQAMPAEILPPLPDSEIGRRQYVRDGGDRVTLEIRYYPRGVAHSPRLALPGADWERSMIEVVRLQTEAGLVTANRILASPEGGDRKGKPVVIVYWYHERGRIVAKESWAKLYQVWDRLWRRRADGALVSISTEGLDVRQARERTAEFAGQVLPAITKTLPRAEGIS